jgi:hypothetical protein
MASQIHVGDTGTQLIVTVYDDGVIVDISTASTIQILLKNPSGVTSTHNASLFTDGEDGVMYYASAPGDFSEPGVYKIQGKVVLSGGTYFTSISNFRVHCNL